LNAISCGLFVSRVLRNEALSPTCRLLIIQRPEEFPAALPGQFVSIRVSDAHIPLLRRPFSIMDLTKEEITLLVKIVGRGTAMIAGRQAGEELDMMGPLGGAGFPPPGGEGAAFVAGGTGLAPVVFAARAWRRSGLLGDSILFYGASSGDEIFEDLAAADFGDVRFATIDGSAGFHGDVVALCESFLQGDSPPGDLLYSCGPRAMAEALVERVEERFKDHYTSLETVMACGVGACRGCTVPIASSGGIVFKSVCSDGTVFRARDIAWGEWED
jgi:dihydroorotate dehydrogenase electron transfer subunit